MGVPNPLVVFHAGTIFASASFVPLSAGKATLSLTAPAPYVEDPTIDHLDLTINAPALSLAPSVTLGRDLQTSVQVSAAANFADSPVVTVTSADPSRLLISPAGAGVGQPSITLSTRTGSSPSFLQALADNGSTSVTVSANGYAPATEQVNTTAAVFNPNNTVNLFTTSGAQQYMVSLTTVDPLTLRPIGYGGIVNPRPGANLTVQALSSDPTVALPDSAPITFSTSGAGICQNHTRRARNGNRFTGCALEPRCSGHWTTVCCQRHGRSAIPGTVYAGHEPSSACADFARPQSTYSVHRPDSDRQRVERYHCLEHRFRGQLADDSDNSRGYAARPTPFMSKAGLRQG